jgi:hypothetical protein
MTKRKKQKSRANRESGTRPSQARGIEPIPREILEARIREALHEMSRRHLEETGEQLCWGQVLNVERMLCDPEHMAIAALEDLEAALARPPIRFADSEVLERCDGIINAGSERLLTKAERHKLLKGREELAARLEKAKKPEEERRILRIAENLLDIAKTERWVKEDAHPSSFTPGQAEVVADFLKKRKILYRQFHALLDKIGEGGFCRCTEAVWDQWVHGGPAEFLQDVNVYHMAKIHPLIQAEAERKGMPELIPSEEEYASAMRRSYPGESHLTEGLMDKSYGFVVPLPLLPRHLAKYVISRHRKQWYVTWMQWYLSYGATVDPKTEEWKCALEASYEPLVCKLVKKARRRIAEEIPASQRRELVERIEKQLRSELRRAIDDFDFFFKKVTYIGSKRFRLLPPPRLASILTSNEIPFTAYIKERLRGKLRTLILGEWQLGEAGYAEIIYIADEAFMSERLTSAALGVTRQTLFNWRRRGKISGQRWNILSRCQRPIDFRGDKTPPSSWVFYSESEVRRIHEMRKRRDTLSGRSRKTSEQIAPDASQEVAQIFAEAQDHPAQPKGEHNKKHRDDKKDRHDEVDPQG